MVTISLLETAIAVCFANSIDPGQAWPNLCPLIVHIIWLQKTQQQQQQQLQTIKMCAKLLSMQKV